MSEHSEQAPWDPTLPEITLDDLDLPDSWKPVDLGPYLRGEVERPTPTIGLHRDDGLALLYPGKEHSVIGETESGKSWYAAACSLAEIDNGNHVVYIHWEESDPGDTVERMLALGASEPTLLELFHFIAPERPATSEALASLIDYQPVLIIHDGVTEAMTLHGWNVREEEGAAEYRRRLVKPFTAAGAAVLSTDHVVKDKDGRGRYALGSVHKANGLTGALIVLENVEPFGRGTRGRSRVYVTKDRPGHLRRAGHSDRRTPGKTYLGEMTVDDTRTFVPWTDVKFWAPKDQVEEAGEEATNSTAKIDEQILQAIRTLSGKGEPATVRAIRAESRKGSDATITALERLRLAGKVTRADGPRGAHIYSVVTVPDLDPTDRSVPDPLDRSCVPGPIGPGNARNSHPPFPRNGQERSGTVRNAQPAAAPTQMAEEPPTGDPAACAVPGCDRPARRACRTCVVHMEQEMAATANGHGGPVVMSPRTDS